MEETLFGLKEMGGIEFYEVIDSYMECRKKKRRTVNALKFEIDWEGEALRLWEDINNGTYRPGRSIAFRRPQTHQEGDIRGRLQGPCGTPPDKPETAAAA